MVNTKAYELVDGFRNKAIAVLRLMKVNALVEELQIANSDLKTLTKEKDENTKKLEDVARGEFSPSYNDMDSYNSPEEAREAVTKRLNDRNESLDKEIESANKRITEIEDKIVKAGKGEKPYRLSRSTITSTANKLIEQSFSDLNLADLEIASEPSGDEEFAAPQI